MTGEPLPPVSPMTLGAVQLGMPYGVANRSGQPSYEEARDIIAAAWENGVTCIDTAAAYGDSEAVIGRALRELGLQVRMTVVTKVASLGDEPLTRDEARHRIADSITGSLERLGRERLDFCLFHREGDVQFAPELLADTRVACAGVSIMEAEYLQQAMANGLRAVQIPANLVDLRCTREGDTRKAGEKGIVVFARSAYLQGLLLMPEAQIPTHLAAIAPVRRRLERVAADAGMTLAELALRYVLSLPGVRSVVVGAESVEQVRRNAQFAARGPLDSDVRRAAEAAVSPDLPYDLITPHRWPRLAAALQTA